MNPVDPASLDRAKADLRAGRILPVRILTTNLGAGKVNIVVEGVHRIQAAIDLKIEKIPYEIASDEPLKHVARQRGINFDEMLQKAERFNVSPGGGSPGGRGGGGGGKQTLKETTQKTTQPTGKSDTPKTGGPAKSTSGGKSETKSGGTAKSTSLSSGGKGGGPAKSTSLSSGAKGGTKAITGVADRKLPSAGGPQVAGLTPNHPFPPPGGLEESLFPPTSRYHGLSALTHTRDDGKVVAYLERRFLPDPTDFEDLREHQVVEGDRLDNLAYQYLGEP